MATQLLTVAALGGDAADAVTRLFERWNGAPNPSAVDRFCAELRAHKTSLPVLYFTEWVDRWSMGDVVPGQNAVSGRRYMVCCMTPAEAILWADTRSDQFDEYQWFAARLREAATAWEGLVERRTVVVMREAFRTSTGDDEVERSLVGVPSWLASIT